MRPGLATVVVTSPSEAVLHPNMRTKALPLRTSPLRKNHFTWLMLRTTWCSLRCAVVFTRRSLRAILAQNHALKGTSPAVTSKCALPRICLRQDGASTRTVELSGSWRRYCCAFLISMPSRPPLAPSLYLLRFKKRRDPCRSIYTPYAAAFSRFQRATLPYPFFDQAPRSQSHSQYKLHVAPC